MLRLQAHSVLGSLADVAMKDSNYRCCNTAAFLHEESLTKDCMFALLKP